MKFTIEVGKKNIIYTVIVALLSVVGYLFADISLSLMLAVPILYLVIQVLHVKLNPKWNWIAAVVFYVASSYLTVWMVQFLLLDQELRKKISDDKFLLNVLCCLVCYVAVETICNHVGYSCMIVHVLLMIFAGVNYFVYQFRGNEFNFGDVKAAFTGLSVATNYNFSLDARAMAVILFTVLYITLCAKFQISFEKAWLMRVFMTSIGALLVVYVGMQTTHTVTETWEQKGTYKNGYLLNFVLSVRDSFVDKPEHYSEEMIAALEQTYQSTDTSSVDADGKKPTIIAIMDESFADLEALGELHTTKEVMPFIKSLKDNTIYGKALASVYGAKTPNSEWEFMTGNSMAWLPSGSVAYQQYLEEENAYSVVDTLKKEGYTCVAMHPYYDTGWSRNTVYPQLGFEEMYFLDDFDQTDLMRKYVSDATMFDKIIERYEQGKGNETLFLMGITMQNHGGYTERYSNFYANVRGVNASYPDVNQYLSLAHQTDLAVEELIGYFKKVDEPVVICFFGDHQPSLNASFYRMMNGKGLSGLTLAELESMYEVPFFIWTNYESESREVERTSLNFLSTMMLQKAGIELSPYQQFLADMMEDIPAINARAYYSNEYDKYLHLDESYGVDAEWLQKYQALQYNGLFETDDKSKIFFGR